MKDQFILITEDDADDRFLLQHAFSEKNFKGKLQFMENGVELINFLFDCKSNNSEFPMLILLDLNMPKKDGREALKEIKEHPDFKNIPVIIFTTTNSELEMARCKSLGADRYVIKPVTFDGLLNVVDEIANYRMPISA